MRLSELTIKEYIDNLDSKLSALLKTPGYNEYVVLYYEGKIDALKSLLKNGKDMCELDSGFGL